ncbi:hypothetical protein B7494_g5226 [Chlorociboria aeruginascens]|nr:hypothetical protein B7494_g5226 [Chlorociboria aeruginascens]
MASAYALPASAMTHSHHGHAHVHSHAHSRSHSPSRTAQYSANTPRSMRHERSNGSLHVQSLSESHHDPFPSPMNSFREDSPQYIPASHYGDGILETSPDKAIYDDSPANSYEPPLHAVNTIPHDLDHAHTRAHAHSHGTRIQTRSTFTSFLLPRVQRWPLLHTILADKDSRRIFYFMSLNFAFMVVQAFYGFVTDSLGLLSDSIHMFFDCLALGVGLFAAIASKWPPSELFPYGFGKIESLSGFGNGVFLMLISIEIMIEAMDRLAEGRETKRLAELFVVSSLGLAVNLIGMACFGHHGHAGHNHESHSHDHGHSHSHDHDHDHDHKHTPVIPPATPEMHSHVHSGHSHSHDNENMRGIFLHVLADTMGSAAVIVSTILIHFLGWSGWDPLASCLIAILIFLSSIPLVSSSAKKLLLTVPDDIEYNLRETLAGVSDLRGVASYSVPRFWMGDKNIESEHEQVLGVMHVIATRGSDLDDVKNRTRAFLMWLTVDCHVTSTASAQPYESTLERYCNSQASGTNDQLFTSLHSPSICLAITVYNRQIASLQTHCFSLLLRHILFAMLPSGDDIANFMAFAPDADEGKAFVFLEASHLRLRPFGELAVTGSVLKGAKSVEEAVAQFYEDPDKYSHSPVSKSNPVDHAKEAKMRNDSPPLYAPPTTPAPITRSHRPHTNAVIEAGHVRARDEQEMQNQLQSIQLANRIYNSDIEPEHDSDYYCGCAIHQYKRRKIARLGVQDMWSKAVMYPGEKAYNDCYQTNLFSSNPYQYRVVSPYGTGFSSNYYGFQTPSPRYHAMSVRQTIQLNATLNAKAEAAINAKEPQLNIWEIDKLESSMSSMAIAEAPSDQIGDKKGPVERKSSEKQQSIAGSLMKSNAEGPQSSRFASLKKAFSIKSPDEKEAIRREKMSVRGRQMRNAILEEEQGRWPDQEWRQIVAAYQEKVGMTRKIADLRVRHPTQYLHLLRAGYFEPIPVAWANLASNPLKFSIEAAAGWRGITPSWRGYEDTAEERLYWVLNHREGSVGMRLKPDVISAMDMARARMASAVEPPPAYFSPDDTCHLQHTSEGYSKQVMPAPFRAFDAPEVPTDDTMILLDVSGSMDFDPLRPNYDQYCITGYSKSTQPKNKG